MLNLANFWFYHMEDNQIFYDPSNKDSILKYAKELCGRTFANIIEKFNNEKSLAEESAIYDVKHLNINKGKLGNIVETCWFHIKQNSDHAPDFPIVGVELKVSPFEYTKDKEIRAGERVVITQINFNEPPIVNLSSTILWSKMEQVLFVFYHRDRTKERLDYNIEYVGIYNIPEKDILIIKEDYKKLIGKIMDGKAHEISEGDTMYLGACTKGAKSTDRVDQYKSNIKAKPRAFCFKQPYVTYMLQTYFVPSAQEQEKCEEIVSVEELKRELTFEEIVVQKINKYQGKTDKELCNLFGIEYTGNKAQWITLTYKMLGINSGRAEEFVKAGISVKTTRLSPKGLAKEPSPLPPMRMLELDSEKKWEDSILYDQLTTLKYLFAVYRDDGKGKDCVLLGAKLWNMPSSDLVDAKMVWEKTKNIVANGVKFKRKTNSKGTVSISNNLPGIASSKTIHVRPHTSKTYYKFSDGTVFGKGTESANGDKLPDGQIMTRQSFWYNPKYITEILADVFSSK